MIARGRISAALDKDGDAMFQNLNTVTFAEHGAQTKLTVHAKVETTTEQGLPYLAGMSEGWKMTLDRMADYSRR